MEQFNRFPETELVIGFLLQIPLQNQSRLDATLAANNKGLLALQLGSTLIKKSVFDKTGGFDEELILSEDTDWFFRVREADVKVRINKEVVQFYRLHDKNITLDRGKAKLFQLKVFKKSLDRRRKAGLNAGSSLSNFNNVDEIMKYWTSK
jgi:GT2 family glycosyltransferase